ncbi:hypothetical protein PHYBLDRAFT_66022 [Phycomyces blakesleeanus NRRL 1555(-)]|uniref:Uncharacterized protein n=1 Tax=Phycomyces blakesleeanus (strain ATCC 8743b / DSM 1359 / FGSC 10004 / NBRC 33097 / NRRL 1555) TaxID=763407 RepID=A0A163AGZ2_PHYB8|nr:hypothetical protein PHYBLDRAFT_66022 [Phycomyces blakesleeanus NRRL 1555(-)]OAD73411.1 hypothetical protein PHYBLDRAFT_66022 [Phycomyces blakesleeanus NRRL 1555(-)]|eukprot:XP_018291451.1 hypothetical protein PHYBLDRAFT_66022 [Phycomyces blakesleeanus NRRL 1555(-)]
MSSKKLTASDNIIHKPRLICYRCAEESQPSLLAASKSGSEPNKVRLVCSKSQISKERWVYRQYPGSQGLDYSEVGDTRPKNSPYSYLCSKTITDILNIIEVRILSCFSQLLVRVSVISGVYPLLNIVKESLSHIFCTCLGSQHFILIQFLQKFPTQKHLRIIVLTFTNFGY